MASTDTVRGWFHETVSNHAQRGTPGYEPRCNWSIAEIAPFPAEGGGTYREPVHPATTEAWDAYIKVMEHFGETIPSAGGVNSCRNIGSTDWPSLHAYLVAVDHPPNSRMRQDFIEAILAIRTNNGKQVFLNGVVFNDRMHNQLNCSQADLATGIDWNTVKGAEQEMTPEQEARIIEAIEAIPVATSKVKVERGGQLVSWIQETADIKTLLLAGEGDVSDADLEEAVSRMIDVIPERTRAVIKAAL